MTMTLEPVTLSPVQEQGTWQYKAVLAARGNQTLLGCIILQIIGKQPKHPPMITGLAMIDEDGVTWAPWLSTRGKAGLAPLGMITDIRDEFRRLADYLKLDDQERIDMFDELRKWVDFDARADHDELRRTGTLH